MGQVDSKINGVFVFAYQVNSKKHYYTEQPSKSKEYGSDPILTHPELYGLNSSECTLSLSNDSFASSSLSSLNSIVSLKKIDRPDSGYMSPSYDGSIQLAQDLSYIDYTYYPLSAHLIHDNQQENLKINNDDDDDGDSSFEISLPDMIFASPDKSLTEVYLPCRAIQRLSPNIGMLTMIRKLDLSNNHLIELPESIGYLQNLEALSLAKNCLVSLPDTICHLSSLLELDVSYNQLASITPYLGCLEKLKSIKLAVNRITQLPTEIRGLANLISLDLSQNPLYVLPAEVANLPFLRRIRCEGCPFDLNLTYTLKHNPPSLVELCARTSLVRNINLKNVSYLPPHIINYIKSAKMCSSCNGPYFESFVLRGRLMEKSDVHIPLQYILCSAHWSDADDRITSMFSTQSETLTEEPEILPYRPPLPPLAIVNKMPSVTARRTNQHPNSHHTLENSVTHAPKLRNGGRSTLSRLSTTFKRPSLPWS